MDFIDYVTLMLINMVAGLLVLAWFFWTDADGEDNRRWAAPFGVTGLIATATGFVMIFTWPLPGPYNITHGELSVFFGAIYLGIAWCLAKRWDLRPLAIYAIPAGLAAMIVGLRVGHLGLTRMPWLSAAGYILSGIAGIAALPVLHYRRSKGLRALIALILVAAALIWAATGYMAYWEHLGMAQERPQTTSQTSQQEAGTGHGGQAARHSDTGL